MEYTFMQYCSAWRHHHGDTFSVYLYFRPVAVAYMCTYELLCADTVVSPLSGDKSLQSDKKTVEFFLNLTF